MSIRQADIDARRQAGLASLTDLDRQIAQVDDAVAESTRRGHTMSAMSLVDHQAPRRNQLVAARGRVVTDLGVLQVEGVGAANQRNQLAAETGPVLYLSTLIGINQKAAARWFTFLVAALLDPLALTLLLAASAPDGAVTRERRRANRRQH